MHNLTEQTLKCAILGTTAAAFRQLNNGQSSKSQINDDHLENTKRFVLNPQIMPFIQSGHEYNLVSASIIIGDVMGMYIESTPFANDLYSQLDGRGHDFAIGRYRIWINYVTRLRTLNLDGKHLRAMIITMSTWSISKCVFISMSSRWQME